MKFLPTIFLGSFITGAGSVPLIVKGSVKASSELKLPKAGNMCLYFESGNGTRSSYKLGYWYKKNGNCGTKKDNEIFLWKGSFESDWEDAKCVQLQKSGVKYVGVKITSECFRKLIKKGFAVKK